MPVAGLTVPFASIYFAIVFSMVFNQHDCVCLQEAEWHLKYILGVYSYKAHIFAFKVPRKCTSCRNTYSLLFLHAPAELDIK